jgi:hypothetical protein
MRGNENYARQDLSKRASKKKTHKIMPLNQRLVLEALKIGRHATIRAVSEDLDKSRDILKNVFATLEAQGYVERLGKTKGTLPGPLPDVYRWTGKSFPPSSEIAKAQAVDMRVISPEIAAVVAGMHAMCRVGRIAA